MAVVRASTNCDQAREIKLRTNCRSLPPAIAAIENRARAAEAATPPSSILATIKALGDYSEAERMLEYNSVGRDVYNCLPFDSTFDFFPHSGQSSMWPLVK